MQTQYTKQAMNVMKFAAATARKMGHPYLGTEHLLMGLRREYTGVAGQILAQHGVEEEKILKLMDELIAPVSEELAPMQKPKASPRFQYILEESVREAEMLHSIKTGTEHMLLAVIHDPDCIAARILTTLNVNFQKILQDILFAAGVDPKEYLDSQHEEQGGGALAQYCKDLTEEAEEGRRP